MHCSRSLKIKRLKIACTCTKQKEKGRQIQKQIKNYLKCETSTHISQNYSFEIQLSLQFGPSGDRKYTNLKQIHHVFSLLFVSLLHWHSYLATLTLQPRMNTVLRKPYRKIERN